MGRGRKPHHGAAARTPGVTRPPAREHSEESGAGARERGPADPILGLQRSAGNLGVGRMLEAGVRRDFERLFAVPLGDVRVHTDADAAASAEERGAAAYTIGNQVVFGADRYAPGTSDGRTLLAHELAHVVQQARGAARGGAPPPGAGAEQEAARAAGAVARGLTPQVAGATGVGLARNEDEEQKKGGAKKGGGKKGGGEKAPKAKGKKPPAEPEIVGEYQGVPVKRYPPKGGPPKQKVYVKPPVPEELPEGTHSTVESPPGSGKVNPSTEAGIWAHSNFEKIENIIKPEAEQLTSEKLPEGLRKEVEVPDPRLPPGRRPRIDRVNDATGEIIEIKPESLRQQGAIEAQAYAEQMNRFEKRSDGKQWVGRCVTYDEKKVRDFLRSKGYTEPESVAPQKVRPPPAGKRQPPSGKAKGTPEKAPVAVPPKIRPRATEPAVEAAPVPPAPIKPAASVPPAKVASATEGVASLSRAKLPAVEPAPGPIAGPGVGPKVQQRSFSAPRPPSMRGAIVGGLAGAAAMLLMMWLSSKLDVTGEMIQADIEKRSKAIEDQIQAQEASAIELFAADPSKPVYANVLVTVEFWGSNEAEVTGPVPIESYAGISSVVVTLSRDNTEKFIDAPREYNWARPFMWERHPMIIFSMDLQMAPMSFSRD